MTLIARTSTAELTYSGPTAVRLVGRYAAVEMVVTGRMDPFDVIGLVDLKTGKETFAVDTVLMAFPYPTDGGPSRRLLRDIVIARNGAVAWTARNLYMDPPTVQVYTADADSQLVQLDAGPGVDAFSLELTDQTVSWTTGGVQKTANIAPQRFQRFDR